jgi:energy-coupling factor transporter ATP-binding protein EcfA2
MVGFGLQFSELPRRTEGAIACWFASAALCNQAKSATEQAEKYQHRRDVLEWASEEAQISAIAKSVQPSLPSLQLAPAVPQPPALYNWQDAIDEGVGFIIAGNSGSGKSSVATWLTGLLTQAEPAQCLVLDPHWNDIWAQQGLSSIGKIEEIEKTIKALLKELDERCDRKGKSRPLGDPLLIIADEIGACLERFKDPKWIQSALKRLGSEGRKFKMTLIAINQSQNVEDLGISGSLRNNYVLILLGAAARKQAQLMGKEYQDILKGTAYPCVVSGSVENCLAIHPTHGNYDLFKKQGNPPQNLIPIMQLPLVFPEPGDRDAAVTPGASTPINQDSKASTSRELLEKSFNLPTANQSESIPQVQQKQPSFTIDDVLPELQPVVKYSLKKGWVKAIQCKRDVRALKSISTEEIREYFVLLNNQGCGTVRGVGDFLEYSAFEESEG